MYDRILVPTDGSAQATAAARRAFDLAERYDATVDGLYVIDTDTGFLTVSKSEVRESLRAIGEDEGREALAAVKAVAAEFDVELHTELREGSPDEEILAAVDEAGVDLVVMGTHGRGGIRRRLVGSVAERIVRASPVPVMTVSEPGDESE